MKGEKQKMDDGKNIAAATCGQPMIHRGETSPKVVQLKTWNV